MKAVFCSLLLQINVWLGVAQPDPVPRLTVAVLGDSYSTFDGYIPAGNQTYYSASDWAKTGVTDVKQTWWWQVVEKGGFKLGVNDSFGGVLESHAQRERILLDEGWLFAFGNAASPEKDFGCGTEYFNYLTKAASVHNEGPYSLKFDEKKWGKEWKRVDLPHDWAVDLPFSPEASHSHGYKTIGHKYPETSVGWYRKFITVPASDKGRHLYLQFDGIFRDARVWVNGFYLGHEPSGYATQIYDISEYLNYGGENLITVRVDATLEEGWFYEGAGIYRHVWLNKTAPLHVAPFGTFVHSEMEAPYDRARLTIETEVTNSGLETVSYRLRHTLLDADGKEVENCVLEGGALEAKVTQNTIAGMEIERLRLWSVDTPYLYKVRTEVFQGDKLTDVYMTDIGFRDIDFDANQGILLNGKPLKLKGVNMHQDHPGVGAAIPDAVQIYRLSQLKKFGCNAYRASHNPMTPELLDACDRLGFLVIDENRLTGVNEEHIRLLERMIKRDRNHPCVMLWSVGNEEWGMEWSEQGKQVIASMREYCHRIDPSRLMTVASSGGPAVLVPADVAGYNYLLQNPIDKYRTEYPQRKGIGTEEISGCGTRGIYFDNTSKGYIAALNRTPDEKDGTLNRIGRGWKFYDERPWLGGLFYWIGFDFRGEPKPIGYPQTGTHKGIFDYCGFPKDEAYYLKSWWTEEPVLHIFPHWNLEGHEGDSVSVWAYSNCDEVELIVNGKKLGRKPMPKNGHLSWETVYRPGTVKAIGYKNGKRQLVQTIRTAGKPERILLTADRDTIQADNRDVSVINVELQDKGKNFTPTACVPLKLTVDGPIRILGVGNGDPAYKDGERPADRDARTYQVKTFNGLAQILLQSTNEKGTAVLSVESEGTEVSTYTIHIN